MAPRRYLRWKSALSIFAAATCLCWSLSRASAADDSDPKSAATVTATESAPADEPSAAPPTSPSATPDSGAAQRQDLNLLGVTDANSGESRRNENVQFNPVDNNALKELNARVGITATIVEQFKVDRSYFGNEFGNRAKAPPHLAASKLAGFHGTIHETHLNSLFTARAFFQAGKVKPARENDYGFTTGTPLWRGGYFYAEASQKKIRGNVNGNVLVPKADERTPLATDPETREVVASLLAAFPNELPNRTDIDERALNTNSPQIIDTDNIAARLDQAFDRDRLTMRYSQTAQSIDAFQLIAGQNPDTNTQAHLARLTWNRAWSAATITDFSMGFDRVSSVLVPEPNNVGPNVQVSGVFTNLGPSPSVPLDRAQNSFRYAGRWRHVRGRHALTAGFDFLRRQTNGTEVSSHRGFIDFRNDFGNNAVTNFLLGTPGRFSGAVGNAHRGFRNSAMQFYFGDDWRVNSKLTLNIGVRFQPLPRPSEVNGLNTFSYPCDCNNIGGQFGLAYRFPGALGVVRGAYGLHYAEIVPSTFQQVRFNPPGTTKFSSDVPNLVELLRGLTFDVDPNARSTVFQFPPNLVAPYSQQYNFSWEPGLSDAWKLQLGYVGSRSIGLFMRVYGNRALRLPGIEPVSTTVNDRRPIQDHFDIRTITNISRGYFDAARASLIVPRWRGILMDASYWFSKAIDLGSDFTATATSGGGVSRSLRNQTESNIFGDLKGPSAFDQSHAFLSRISYETPALSGSGRWVSQAFGQWTVSAVALLKTGTPFSVISGSDAPGFGNVDGSRGDRPNVLDTSVLGTALAHPDDRANLPRSAFAFITIDEASGNLGRNTFRKDGIRNINGAVSRTWRVHSEKTLMLRAESINLFNTPQFAEPTNVLTSPSFGQITNTLNDGRTFQFLLRFSF